MKKNWRQTKGMKFIKGRESHVQRTPNYGAKACVNRYEFPLTRDGYAARVGPKPLLCIKRVLFMERAPGILLRDC